MHRQGRVTHLAEHLCRNHMHLIQQQQTPLAVGNLLHDLTQLTAFQVKYPAG